MTEIRIPDEIILGSRINAPLTDAANPGHRFLQNALGISFGLGAMAVGVDIGLAIINAPFLKPVIAIEGVIAFQLYSSVKKHHSRITTEAMRNVLQAVLYQEQKRSMRNVTPGSQGNPTPAP